MEVDFDNLIALQKIDDELKHISSLLEKIPQHITEIERKLNESDHLVEKAKEKLSLNQKNRRELEVEVKDIKFQITKYKTQLNEVKTNREYSSLLKEIEEATRKVDSFEEKIIGEMLDADDTEKEIQEATRKFNEEEDKCLREKQAFNQRKKELESRIKELNREKENLIPRIPSQQVKLYLDIFKKKNGISLSPVTDEFCSLCHMRIRPQVINELIGRENLIFCENCGRILCWIKKES